MALQLSQGTALPSRAAWATGERRHRDRGLQAKTTAWRHSELELLSATCSCDMTRPEGLLGVRHFARPQHLPQLLLRCSGKSCSHIQLTSARHASVLLRSRPCLGDLHQSREGVEAGHVPKIRMRRLLLVASAAVELPSLARSRALSSPPPPTGSASLRVGELLEQRHGTEPSVQLASARAEKTTSGYEPAISPNKHHSMEAALQVQPRRSPGSQDSGPEVLPALTVLPF